MSRNIKPNISFTKLGSTKIGRVTETPIEVFKNKGDLTIKDVVRLKQKIIKDGLAKYDHAEVLMIKVLAGSWMTFSSEEKFNDYFSSKVLDASKFYEFSKVVFYVQTQ